MVHMHPKNLEYQAYFSHQFLKNQPGDEATLYLAGLDNLLDHVNLVVYSPDDQAHAIE